MNRRIIRYQESDAIDTATNDKDSAITLSFWKTPIMQDGGRISAAIEILSDVVASRSSVKVAVRKWNKGARYAGSKDRAWIAGLVLDALRRKNSASWLMKSDNPRGIVLGTLRLVWKWNSNEIQKAFADTYAPSIPLTEQEKSCLDENTIEDGPAYVQGDYPKWLNDRVLRVFQSDAVSECQAFARRAGVGLRVNTLKFSEEHKSKLLAASNGESSELLKHAFRIPAPDPWTKDTSLERIPAYSKGLVEVQDEGSQISACATNAKPGENVLDYCAGAGGKTLALSAMMSNEGTIYAHDRDSRRLTMLVPRLRKSGATIIRMINTAHRQLMEDQRGKFDCVLADVPCTGTGTWRRKPESKWLVSETALSKRISAQNQILRDSAQFVKPKGRLVYVVCSFLLEEGEDRIEEFLSVHSEFKPIDAAGEAIASGQLTEFGEQSVRGNQTNFGGVRLTPRRANTDGFFFAVLQRQGSE